MNSSRNSSRSYDESSDAPTTSRNNHRNNSTDEGIKPKTHNNPPTKQGHPLVRSASSDAEIESSCQVVDKDPKRRKINTSGGFEPRGGEEMSYSPFRRESLFRGMLFMCVGFGAEQVRAAIDVINQQY